MNQPAGYAPPPRGGRPWWIWALGGCGGCLLVVILLVAGGTLFVKNRLQSMNVGPITPAAMEKSLGVPAYPGASLEPTITEYTLKTIRLTTGPSMFKGVAAYTTPDSPDKVEAFYRKKLTAGGWVPTHTTNNAGAAQQQYQKGREVFIVQEQQHQRNGSGTMIMLMRGGPQIAQHAPSPGAGGTAGGTGGGSGGQ